MDLVTVTDQKPAAPAPREVSVPLPGGDEITAKRGRGRPPGSKNKSGGSGTTSSNRGHEPIPEEQVNAAIVGGSNLLASILGQPHWQVAPEQAGMVGKPLARISGRIISSEFMEKWGDWIALTVGLLILLVPRIILTLKMKEVSTSGLSSNVRPIRPAPSPSPSADQNGRPGQQVASPGGENDGKTPSTNAAFLAGILPGIVQ